MIPQQVLSSVPVPGPFLSPDDVDENDPLTDYEMGGIAIRDPSQGLRVQIWTFGYAGGNVTATSPATGTVTLFSQAAVTELSGAFDQNMNPTVAFIAGGVPKLWWFDPTVNLQVFTEFDGITSPKVALDDKRPLETLAGSSDVIFAYLKGTSLYFRAQRDRYGTEYLLQSNLDPAAKFLAMGMSSINRFQFKFRIKGTSQA